MPHYDYECSGCEKVFEVFKSMTEDHSQVCPECGQKATRLFSPPGIVFKGRGFYTIDKRNEDLRKDPNLNKKVRARNKKQGY